MQRPADPSGNLTEAAPRVPSEHSVERPELYRTSRNHDGSEAEGHVLADKSHNEKTPHPAKARPKTPHGPLSIPPIQFIALVPQTWFGSAFSAFPGHRVRWNSLNNLYLSDAESGGLDRRIMAPSQAAEYGRGLLRLSSPTSGLFLPNR